jgi:hypothetical protein
VVFFGVCANVVGSGKKFLTNIWFLFSFLENVKKRCRKYNFLFITNLSKNEKIHILWLAGASTLSHSFFSNFLTSYPECQLKYIGKKHIFDEEFMHSISITDANLV